MPRIRTIKPEFYTSEDVVALSMAARLFYPALWCEADREGRMEWRPGSFKLRYFPADDVNIDALADEMEVRGMLLRYEVGGKRYAALPNFTKHQLINNREQASQIPGPPPVPRDASPTAPDACPTRDDASPTAPDACPTRDDASPTREHATTTPLAGRKGKEVREGKDHASATRATKPKPFPLPDGFVVSERVRKWAREKGVDHLDDRFESFVGKARAKGYTYVDWDEALMAAIREGWASPGGSNSTAGTSGASALPF